MPSSLQSGAPAPALTPADYQRGARGVFAAAMVVLVALHSANTSWNVNSRMALVFAIVDRSTFAIDGYHEEHEIFPTGDKAEYGGHVYSDKVFGVSLLCVPVYALMQAIAKLFGFEWDLQLKIYVLRLVSSSIPAAVSLSLLWLMMVRSGAMPRRSVVAVAIAFFGSLWFGYSTLAMPYSPGIASSLAAMYLMFFPPPSGLTPRRAAAIGFCCGFALICDFLFAPIIVFAIVAVFFLRVRRQAQHRLTSMASAAVAGAFPLALFASYTYFIFGTLSLPYQYEVMPVFREGMSQGVMGVTTPQFGRLWFLTLHPFRGIFFWSPWVALALIGCAFATRQTGLRRTFGWMGLWAFASALYLNASYYMWWGGFAMGPRLMLPMMAAVPLGLGELCCRERSIAWWRALVVTGVIACALSIPLALTDPQMPQMEDTARLLEVTVTSQVPVAQFDYLWRYYSGDWFWGPESRDHLLRALAIPAMALAGFILYRTARRLPPR